MLDYLQVSPAPIRPQYDYRCADTRKRWFSRPAHFRFWPITGHCSVRAALTARRRGRDLALSIVTVQKQYISYTIFNRMKQLSGRHSKVVRDSFTMPMADYQRIGLLKQRCIGLGVAIKKSELLRAGLAVLEKLPDESLASEAAAVESVKTGRPPGSKKKKKRKKGKKRGKHRHRHSGH